jgi:hypothetical protein
MDHSDVRTLALSLPESVESPHFDMTSFRVGGKIFATMPSDGAHLHVFVDEGEVRAAVAEDPGVFEELLWGKRLSGVRVRLGPADHDRVRELLEESWRRKAPKHVVAAFDDRPRPR